MNHIDLFSGIGGFALAARNVWGGAYRNVCFCEINKYCGAVLRKNFGKDVVIIDDIRKLTKERLGVVTNADSCGCVHGQSKEQSAEGAYETQCKPIASVESSDVSPNPTSDRRERQGKKGAAQEGLQARSESTGKLSQGLEGCHIDLLTGGFPCQPFSQAGRRLGASDDRFLWPEMFRVIQEFRPTWIIGENVAGILSMAEPDGKSEVDSQTDLFGNRIDIHTKRGRGILYRIIGELEQIGYSVQTFVIPACAVGAPHRRDRVWIVAHSQSGESGKQTQRESREGSCGGNKKDRTSSYCDNGGQEIKKLEATGNKQCDRGIASNVNGEGLEGRVGAREHSKYHPGNSKWRENWLEVATRFCGVDDGLPGEMDGATTSCQTCGGKGFGRIPCEECGAKEKILSKAGHRVERLKALGNAIVPQVAEEIMRAIKNV